MVLEHLFSEKLLEKKFAYAFLLGVGYSIIGLILGRLLFGSNSGISSVIFASILMIPSLRKMFAMEEKLEEKERKFSIKHLFKDNKLLIKTYIGIFVGVFCVYTIATFLMPMFGFNVIDIMKEQLFIDPAVKGRASFEFGTFVNIISNNWIVLLATFILALIEVDGAIFFIVWNASAWGAIFGYRALTAAWYSGSSPWLTLLILLGIVFLHTIIEGLAYILAAISGSVISRDVISESSEIRKFLGFSVLAMFVGWFIHKFVTYITSSYVFVFDLALTIIIVNLMGNIFTNKKHKEAFIYNYYLFIIAIAIFIIGGLIETSVLSNCTTLTNIYTNSLLFGLK